jgi:tetratricopeptide (TPR) repeat protein
MWPLFLRLRHYQMWIRAHEIGLRSARTAGDHEAERQMLNSGAIGLSAAGHLDEAVDWYARSRRAARSAGDVRDEGQALHGLGTCSLQAGELARASAYLTDAVAVWRSCGYERGVALSRIALGEVALAEGRFVQAQQEFAGARSILLEVDDPHDANRARAFLGSAQARAGEHVAGRDLMLAALEQFTASGATHWQARTLEMLADCAREQGDRAALADFRARAVALYDMTSPRDALRLSATASSAGEYGPEP